MRAYPRDDVIFDVNSSPARDRKYRLLMDITAGTPGKKTALIRYLASTGCIVKPLFFFLKYGIQMPEELYI